MSLLTYDSETMIWIEKERSRIGTVQMCTDKAVVQSDEVCRRKELMNVFSGGLDMWREWRMAGLLRWSMYGNVPVVAHWIDTVKDCSKKLDVRQARKMVH